MSKPVPLSDIPAIDDREQADDAVHNYVKNKPSDISDSPVPRENAADAGRNEKRDYIRGTGFNDDL